MRRHFGSRAYVRTRAYVFHFLDENHRSHADASSMAKNVWQPPSAVIKWRYAKDKTHRHSYDINAKTYKKQWVSYYYEWWPELDDERGGYYVVWICGSVVPTSFGGGGFEEQWSWDYADEGYFTDCGEWYH